MKLLEETPIAPGCVLELTLPYESDRKSAPITCEHGVTLTIDAARRALGLPRLADDLFTLVNRRIHDVSNRSGASKS
jgi:hypothetical protein